jgi:voltage-gated potassium channel
MVGVLVVIGTVGYILIERMSVVDALYMTVITIATVGFGEVHPLDNAGRIFTIGLIVTGVATFAWAAGSGVEVLLGHNLVIRVQRRRMQEFLDEVRDHYIVCGFGRMGRQVVRDLDARKERFVVVDRDPGLESYALEHSIPYVIGDSTSDDVLLRARIDRARGVVAVVGDDAQNVLTVLTARGINPDLQIVARGTDELSESKMRRAGADRIVSPYVIGGQRLALALVQPTAHDFMNHVLSLEDVAVDIGEVRIGAGSALANQTISRSDLRSIHRLVILAIRNDGESEFEISPNPERVIQAGDTLIVFGSPRAIHRLKVGDASPSQRKR